MANLVKTKTLGIGASLLIFFLAISQYDFKSLKENRYKVWSPDSILYSDDFMKTAPFFDEFDGYIRTPIFINEFADGSVKAITKIDKHNSWIRKKAISSYILTHEAYHANITSIGTKNLNKKIKENNLSFDQAIEWRSKFSLEVQEMQERYDKETDHSLNVAEQHYWEYKIDSLFYADVKLDTFDNYGGASAYFPTQPEIVIIKDTFMLLKDIRLQKYNMAFNVSTHYDENIDTTSYDSWYRENQHLRGYINVKTSKGSWNNLYLLESEFSDTLNDNKIFERTIVNGENTYQLSVHQPLEAVTDSFYKIMRENFFSSFNIVSNNKSWLNYLKSGENRVISRTISIPLDEDDLVDESAFTSLSISDNSILYSYPFIDRGSVIFSFKSERHKIDDLKELLVILNDSVQFSMKPDSLFQIFPVDINEFEIGKNSIQFGYLTKSDSTREIGHFYSTVLNSFIVRR